jgi:hypothetical protein
MCEDPDALPDDLDLRARMALLRQQAATENGALITCNGPSMEPTVGVGDRVRVWAVPGIRAGDAVAFVSHGGQMMLHRAVLVMPRLGWFVHVGDAGYDDEPGIAPLDGIIGRADLPRRAVSVRTRIDAVRRLLKAARRMGLRRARGALQT